MKFAIVFALTIAFAASCYADPNAEALADPANPFKKLTDAAKKLYSYVCKTEDGSDRCKKWVSENITMENLKKLAAKMRPYVEEFCSTNENAKTGVLSFACDTYLKNVQEQ